MIDGISARRCMAGQGADTLQRFSGKKPFERRMAVLRYIVLVARPALCFNVHDFSGRGLVALGGRLQLEVLGEELLVGAAVAGRRREFGKERRVGQ